MDSGLAALRRPGMTNGKRLRGKTRSARKGGLLKIPKRALIRNGKRFFPDRMKTIIKIAQRLESGD